MASADAAGTTDVLTCLALYSTDEVDRMVDTALAAGATRAGDPMDYGFMYGRGFNDLDGHIREIIRMGPGHVRA